MSRLIYSILLFSLISVYILPASAQNETLKADNKETTHNFSDWCKNAVNWCDDKDILNGLDAGVSIGTMGIGIELKAPVTKWADIRAGVDWLPSFNVPMTFNLNTYSDGMPTGNFNRVASLVYEYTGLEIDETVHMNGKGSMLNFKFLVDIYPFQSNRHWHFTAGFYAGSSKIADAINTKVEKPTLVALNVYNRAFAYFTNPDLSIFDVPLGGGAYMDPEKVAEIRDKFEAYGRLGIHIGDFLDGTPFIMEPAPNGSVSAKAFVNHFKPYLGAGYSTDLDKDKRWKFGLDLGVLFWGGQPDVIHHDYSNNRDINFTKDLKNIRGKVGEYMKIVKAFPVYPALSIRFSYSIL